VGIPSQVTVKVCASALLALLSIGELERMSRAEAQEAAPACVDPARYTRSVVSIAWYFDEARTGSFGGQRIGWRATAWFYRSPRFLVTAAHFAEGMPTSAWRDVDLRQADAEGSLGTTFRTQIRIVSKGEFAQGDGRNARPRPQPEDLAILELRDPFPNAHVLEIRPSPPKHGEIVLIPSYPAGKLRFANGMVRHTEDASRYGGLSLLEVHGSNRLLLNGGASGAPVLDCREGSVTAVLNGLLTGPSIPFLPPESSVLPTPWGSPTNTAVPATMLDSLTGETL
jgi:Trypsin-like peptidase domain